MLSLEPEAKEVRGVIGAIVLAIPVLDALEAEAEAAAASSFSFSSPSTATATDTEPGYGGDENELPQLPGQSHWKLKPEYLDIVEAVNTLRSTMEDERAGQGGDVGAVILLQGSIPKPTTEPSPRGASKALPTSTTTYDGDRNGADALLEAVEDQLLTDRAILGWDIIAWDGIPKSPSTPTNIRSRASGKDRSGESAAAAQPPIDAADETRNLYGEKTGLPRLLELLHNLDWSALPAQTPSPPSSSSPPTSPHAQSSPSAPNLDLDHDTDLYLTAHFLPSISDDAGSELTTPLVNPIPRTHDPPSTAFRPQLQQEKQQLQRERGHLEDGDEGGDEKRDGDGDGDGEGDEDEESQVEQLQALLQQAMAMREAGREMPSAQRERYARGMVGRLMGRL